jgi:hypothetical protein
MCSNVRMSYISIDTVRIASPCDMQWSQMQGDAVTRFCGDCKKNVYNLSLLTRDEANALILEHEGKLCVSLYRRFDGTVLTADCPKGLRAIRGQYLKTRAKVIAATVAVLGYLGFAVSSCSFGTQTLGEPAYDSTQIKLDTTRHP